MFATGVTGVVAGSSAMHFGAGAISVQSTQMISYDADGPGEFGLIFSSVSAIVLLAAWVILAASRFTQGGVVERPERVPQLYGYTVCLISLIWGLTSALSIVDDALSLSAPELRSSQFGWGEASVTSFEAFRATYDRSRRMGGPELASAPSDTTPEPELRKRYDALRADRIQRSRYEARRELVTGTLSLAIAAGLFVFHWRWVRRRGDAQPA
jgi:hypothetical protein